MASNIYSPNLEGPVLKDAVVPVEDWRLWVCFGVEEDYPLVLALKTQGEIQILFDHCTKLLIISRSCIGFCKPHRIDDSVYKFEASSLGYGYRAVEEDSGEGACGNVRVYLSEPGVLKSKIAERSKPRSILVLTDVHHTSAVSVHPFRLSLVACSGTVYREEFQEIEEQCLAIYRKYCSLIREPDGASWDSICT